MPSRAEARRRAVELERGEQDQRERNASVKLHGAGSRRELHVVPCRIEMPCCAHRADRGAEEDRDQGRAARDTAL
jgi:hypothetical protein